MSSGIRTHQRPSREYGMVQATAHNRGGWTNDLVALTNEAVRLVPDGWDFSLRWGRLFSDQPFHWTAGWCPTRGRGDNSLWADGDTAQEAVARLLDRLGSLPS